MRTICLLALVLGGCADLAAIDSGVCGNGVVERERGEVCDDGPDGSDGCRGPTDVAPCQYNCTISSDCPGEGAACGTDNLCRQPGDAFRQAEPIAVTGSRFVVDLVDDDGYSDVLTRTSDQLTIRYGGADDPLEATQHVQLPVGSSSLGLVDATDDGMADVLIGRGSSAVLFASNAPRSLLPVQQTSIDVADLIGDRCPEIQMEQIATVTIEGISDAQQVAVFGYDDIGAGIGITDGAECEPADECLLGAGVTVAGGRVAHGALARDFDGAFDPPVTGEAFAAPILDSRRVKLFAPTGFGQFMRPVLQGGDPLGFDAGAPFTADGFVAIADLDHDGCGDLAMSPDRRSLRVVWGAPPGPVPATTCGMFEDVSSLALDSESTYLGVVEFGPGYAGLLERDKFGLVTATTATRTQVDWVPERTEIFVTSSTASEAISLDYNHDGLIDLAIRSASTSLDFFLNSGGGYNRFVVELSRLPLSLAAADLDGDLSDDVVFVAEGDVPAAQTANVLYGDRDARPEVEQTLGTFAAPIVAHVIEGPGLDSLLINGNPGGIGCNRPISILIGDTSRQLVSPLLLPYSFEFNPTGPPDEAETFDAEATVDTVVPLSSDGTTSRALLFGPVDKVPPEAAGYERPPWVATLVETISGQVTFITDADGVIQRDPGSDAPYGRDRYATGFVTGDAVEDVVFTAFKCGLTFGDRCLVVIDGHDASISKQTWVDESLPLPDQVQLRDVDGDGDDDLIGFGPGPSTGDVSLWVAINTTIGGNAGDDLFEYDAAGTTSFAEYVGGIACSRVAFAADPDADGAFPVLAACADGASAAVVLARWHPLDGRLVDVATVDVATVDVAVPPELLDVEFGDFNGDGLEEFAALLQGEGGGHSLVRFERCLASDPVGGERDACVLPVAQP